MNLENVSTKELFLELLKRPEVIESSRAYGYGSDINTALDFYEIELDFHLSDEEWDQHFNNEP